MRNLSVKLSYLASFICIVTLSATVYAVPFTVVKKSSRLGFTAHTALFDSDGVFHRWTGQVDINPNDLNATKIKIEVDTASVDTNNKTRDQHLREYTDLFDAKHYPTMTFTSSSVVLKSERQLVVKGTLQVKNQRVPLKVPLSIKWSESKGKRVLTAKGSAKVNRMKVGLTHKTPWYAPTLKQIIDIKIKVTVEEP